MIYSGTVPVIVDLYLSVLLNPAINPHMVVSKAAKAMIKHKVRLPTESGNMMLWSLGKSKMAYQGLMAGVKDLESKGVI